MASVRAIIFDAGSRLLMLKRSASASRPNQWNPPGGRLRVGETIFEACRRELLEETGLAVSTIRVLDVFDTQSYILCRILAPGVDIRLNTDESSSFVWVHHSQLLTIGPISDLRQLVLVLNGLGIEVPPLPES
jgi:8-oxo-dGTP pyrophosphatase MutT (NUDIX family)